MEPYRQPCVGRGHNPVFSDLAVVSPAGYGAQSDCEAREAQGSGTLQDKRRRLWLRQVALEVCATGTARGPTGHWLHSLNDRIHTTPEAPLPGSKRMGSLPGV